MTCINREGDVPPEGHSHLPGNASMGRGGGGGTLCLCFLGRGLSTNPLSKLSVERKMFGRKPFFHSSRNDTGFRSTQPDRKPLAVLSGDVRR